jgi:acyl carrier protein
MNLHLHGKNLHFSKRHEPATGAAMRTSTNKNTPDKWHRQADAALRASLTDVLAIDADRVAEFQDDTALFGALPELDSMAVATLLTDFEDRLGIVIDDDDVDIESFEIFGNLRSMLARKLEDQAD